MKFLTPAVILKGTGRLPLEQETAGFSVMSDSYIYEDILDRLKNIEEKEQEQKIIYVRCCNCGQVDKVSFAAIERGIVRCQCGGIMTAVENPSVKMPGKKTVAVKPPRTGM